MLGKCQQCGFSLIELMIGLVIAGLLVALAAPDVSVWIQNSRTRAAADSILNGLQLARNEAVRNNSTARLSLCGLPLASWEVLAASSTAGAPTVSVACGAGSDAKPGEVRVQEHSAQEGSENVLVVAGTTSITFDSFGRTVLLPVALGATTLAITVSNPSNPPAKDRPLNVVVGVGGTVRMCDPHLPTTGPKVDPRHC